MPAKRPLTVDRVVAAAASVADRVGLGAVSMRNVGKELGVEAMSLYHHVAGKQALVDALSEWLVEQIELPALADPWRPAMTTRARSAHEVMRRHSWGLGLMESRREPGPASLRYHDRILGCLRHNGFSVQLAAHAFTAIDAYVFGFVLTELSLPFAPGEQPEDFVDHLTLPAGRYPHLAEMVDVLVVGQGYDFADEFEYGLELLLDALAARLTASTSAT